MLALTQLSNYLTLKGSFSAVSKPNFAVNMRWKALAESYKMHSLKALHRSRGIRLVESVSKLNFLFENR